MARGTTGVMDPQRYDQHGVTRPINESNGESYALRVQHGNYTPSSRSEFAVPGDAFASTHAVGLLSCSNVALAPAPLDSTSVRARTIANGPSANFVATRKRLRVNEMILMTHRPTRHPCIPFQLLSNTSSGFTRSSCTANTKIRGSPR